MAILGAEVDDYDAFVNGLVISFGLSFLRGSFDIRPRTLQAPGYFQVCRHFQVVAGGDSPSPGKLFLYRGSTSLKSRGVNNLAFGLENFPVFMA